MDENSESPSYSDVFGEERKWTEESILKAWESGQSAVHIAAMQRSSVQTVYQVLRKYRDMEMLKRPLSPNNGGYFGKRV